MGTEKRQRQKANRLQRQIEEARAVRVDSVKRNVMRWVIVAVLALAGVVVIAWLGGAFEGEEEVAPEPTSAPLDDVAEPVTVDLPKPEVEVPAEEPTELVVTDLVEGEGEAAELGDTVTVHYVGVLSADGTEFDNSYDRGTPFPVVLGSGGVIQGWEDGLIGVRPGGRRQLDIPADLAYGDRGFGEAIPPGAALSFVVDVVDVSPAAQQ